MRRRLLHAAIALLLLVGLAALAGWQWLGRGGRPVRSGSRSLGVLSAPVAVRFDDWGVPHLRGESGRDLAAALGWLHANDRFFQMELGRRLVAGRLSELFGERTLALDREMVELRLAKAAARLWESTSPEPREWLEAYAAGVNAWLAERGPDLPPELRLLGLRPEPWRPVDSLGFVLLMARDLSFWAGRPEETRYGWLRAFGAEQAAALAGVPVEEIPAALVELAAGSPAPVAASGGAAAEIAAVGSNNWALGGEWSESGAPLVANDPHLALRLPGVWYQAHLRAPDYEVAGMTLPGTPGVVIGRTARLAWAVTNVMLDDHDLFFEQLDERGERVLRGDGWEPVTCETVTIAVRGADPSPVELCDTDRGPLLPADAGRGLPPRSLAWTAYEPADPLGALLALARAEGVAEVPAAVAPFAAPAQNLLVADRDGGLVQTILGRLPARRQGHGRFPAPGWEPGWGWEGLRPAADTPRRFGGREMRLVTANDDTWGAARPEFFAGDFDSPHRARRIAELLAGQARWTPEGLAGVQNDVRSLWAREIVAALGGPFSGDAERARATLAAWDGEMTARGPAALFLLAERELGARIFVDEARAHGLPPFASRERLLALLTGRLDPVFFDDVTTPEVEGRDEIVAAALAAAWRTGVKRFGPEVARWPYGELHRLRLAHPLGSLPLLGRWFDRGPFPLGGSATTVAAFGGVWEGSRQAVVYGPSMRWVTDLSDPDGTLAILPGGQAGHPADPHYADQMPLFLAGRLRPVPWSEEAIARAAVSTLELVP
ncbi:MAG: penicillin acylase family protein [Acidobacteria bacterium]|nr:penicillin acylase family protein [Acidobacteriota bacterium]